MKIDNEVILNIAELAQLEVKDEMISQYADKMTAMLNLIEEMQSVNTDNIEPVSNPLDAVQTMREDKVTEKDLRDEYQAIAPEVDSGLYLVPRVVE
ncbi:Asp-tRNA(Asn)/Glu-tRNA(Gln) amidotransferase subunit GatC [Pseudomonadales bacterium]|jgi:aspartyl-tRNA(Asn)/glutamyl-tRNA(Gln) amidotransferase subunit C|nr:Asp-tRNA(Asn)/Glu-tRNA(Gln) amidotransferase subunit GatC [Gammaproteobacteria bacterium]MDA7774331.1 Asp-tRNA(Asn)/Glu-tRNA(Gln) amidotransferase subunit GatC [Pseudomonadales bacterium]MBT3735483.1 Asp-tRNA(Asn)/Glu-tRNA(Gln) amidotransferase subunit GatC [Gammaproteobacteria bacterium]MBT3897028.1 Asp-tRNA(Asn)/Glu-tRNA(Gln) amidotransferase subunit GatC [Gammaproteobacteria bacterium]MBT7540063.1 Asp-tRNA(Asn)/Glu-tRNA(Gln) amidotransferase subunit GatC [Gammaproteobacteria bacterium]|tara:strand:- start:1038 stop:1325 length:288 start_codon:yes stop_codon:yes gene_type:complete